MTSSSEKASSPDPLADLDDDLGDDWESAFQAEDFMFSPEEESSDFFLSDENGTDDAEDISDLFAGEENKEKAPAGKDTTVSGAESGAETTGVLEFPGRIQILTASLLQLFQARPLYQRLLISSLPLVLILIVGSTLFFQSTNNELASLNDQSLRSDTLQIAPTTPQGQDRDSLTSQQKQSPTPPQKTESALEVTTIQHKWKLPTFLIVANSEKKAHLIVNIDLTLIANLEKDQSLPEDKKTFVKNIIYQFFANRPAYELKRFSLARGEMISQLNAWLNKQWKNNPFDTIAFSSYQVIQTPPPFTRPPLVPKVTFM